MMFTCTQGDCGITAMAVRPGTVPRTCEMAGETVVLTAGEQAKAWCWDHWRRQFTNDLFAFAGIPSP